MVCEWCVSCNYFDFDEDENSGEDQERTTDRMFVIPYEQPGLLSIAEVNRRKAKFVAVMEDKRRPTELVCGELGDFVRSKEFLEKVDEFGQYLSDLCEETIKARTLCTNYAPMLAMMWKLHQIFHLKWTQLGYTWEKFLDWVSTTYIPFLKRQHREKDSAANSIRYGTSLS